MAAGEAGAIVHTGRCCHARPCVLYIYRPPLQVRILRLLQVLPIPPIEAMRTRLTEVLTHILNRRR